MIPELLNTFDSTVKFIEDAAADLTDDIMIRQPEGAPNHAAWTLGHLIYSFQVIADEMGVEATLPKNWEAQYGYGSVPEKELSRYPKKSEMLEMLKESADHLRSALRSADELELAKPMPDERSREDFPTVGHALMQVVAAHTAFHAGQLAAWRRAVGLKSTGVFI